MPARSPARPADPRFRVGAPRPAASPAPPPESTDPATPGAPALLLVAAVTAAFVALAVTYRLTTPDVWQHLLVGKAIWTTGRIPFQHLWTWPSYGQPEVLNSWGFRLLLWPFWSAGEVWGLQAWRWLTTLAAFGLAWATARCLGARGFAPLVVIAAAVLGYRARAQVRPETLVAVLLAAQIFLLERRRARGGGALALIALSAIWINVHLSFYMGLVLIAMHVMAKPGAGGAAAQGRVARLDRMGGGALLACAVAASFANPFGWRAVWQPFEYFLIWRHEPVYRTISELMPLWGNWNAAVRGGLPFLIALWVVLMAWRAMQRRFDLVGTLTVAFFVALTLFNSRFGGFLAIAIVPYLSRDLSDALGAWRGGHPAERGPALRGAWPRAGVAIAAIVLIGIPAWSDLRFTPGVGLAPTYYPSAACDFMASHGVRGRAFNPFYLGGYMAWRFWPDRERLPFMDIHQSGTRRDRELYTYAFANPEAWNELMRAHDFQIALLDGHQEWVAGDRLLDRLDADPAWALVFRDDAAALYVRRTPEFAGLVDSFAYRVMPGGQEGFVRLGEPVARDSTVRRALRVELERRVAGSALNAQAHSHLANLDFLEGDRGGARSHLDAALSVEPTMSGVHRRLGYLAMSEERWAEAIMEFEREIRIGDPPEDEYARMGLAWERLGDARRAAAAYRRHLAHHAGDERVRRAMEKVEGR